MYLPNDFKNTIKLQSLLKSKPEDYWIKRGEKMALKLFQEMAKRVPAYKDFLKKNNFKPGSVKTIADFKKIPLISKDNYLRQYPLEKLCWDGNLKKQQWDISSTSGSTGEPFYFPRTDVQNAQYALSAELYLRENFQIHKKSTLYINCFALGVWIGGLFTYEALKMAARNGKYNLSTINPGLNKPEIFKAIKKLGRQFDQIIIGGYPPFVKDVVDEGITQDVKWSDYNLKFVFSAEGFSEDFRDYIFNKTGKHNVYLDSLNHYGTVDQGTLAHETPVAIFIRRILVKNKKLFKDVFGESVVLLPTLAQYLPELFYFEDVNNGVVCSAYSGLPLVRYDLKDQGGVLSLEQIKKIFAQNNIDLKSEIKKAGINKSVWNLPFVFVYERSDMCVSLSGANIYPSHVKQVLEEEEFNKYFTGKFTQMSKRDKKQDPYLEVNIELKRGVDSVDQKIQEDILHRIIKNLLENNSEYKVIYEDRGHEKAKPYLKFWPYESSEYFNKGGKQKWSIKN